ncbi:MAG: DUF3667 domain-containing protein [Dysgonamonadaceae bacterium]|jgi:hypothetical protein|nr:DUF3667 domain-containing protein [Dysgonamonadaceae bacterium]
MGRRRKLRENKGCENCGHFVEIRFCPDCGQENVETRQSFFHLIAHFIKDFVHYDGKFWKTIWYLLFRPAKLTKEYLAGKRNCYVNPVKLYIFISFITFLLPAIPPDSSERAEKWSEKVKAHQDISNQFQLDSVAAQYLQPDIIAQIQSETDKHESENQIKIGKYKIDQEKVEEELLHHFPKAIFLYMPVFAFWLWVFHSKRKWFYFDHGIYTLHYFSFILLSISLFILARWLLSLFHLDMPPLVAIVMVGYFIYYFFHSHRIFYQESKAISRLKCSILFIINSLGMIVFLILYAILIAFIFSDVTLNTMIHEIQNNIQS